MKVLIFILLLGFSSFAQNTYNLIPLPKEMTPMAGQFIIKKSTSIGFAHPDFAPVANLLAEHIQLASSFPMAAKTGNSSTIQFTQNNSLGDEAYSLQVSAKKISIQAKTGKGAFYALQTLLQLMPAQIYAGTAIAGPIAIPNVNIKDEPRFSYRGLMLDVGRYYYPVESV
ncbi:MAG: hypothetical protein RL246_291, partial [Bacteroidota bacterium]